MSLNDSLDQVERAKLAVWDYPVSDKFTNMWAAMNQSGFPANFEEAKARILSDDEEFAFIGKFLIWQSTLENDKHCNVTMFELRTCLFLGDATQNKYATLTDCDLWQVGEEFSRKPYALAVQEGSPLKNEISSQ